MKRELAYEEWFTWNQMKWDIGNRLAFMPDETLTLEQVVKVFPVGRESTQRWLKRFRIKRISVKLPSGKTELRYRMKDLVDLVDKNDE